MARPLTDLFILVLTGDHGRADDGKHGGGYGAEDLEAHARMAAAFESLGFRRLEIVASHDGLFERLKADPPDLLVNFCDTGFLNDPEKELVIPAMADALGLTHTGAPAATMALAFDKQIVRLTAESLGVPVPGELFLPGAEGEVPADMLPALIKPNRADGSLGITKDAVVKTPAEAAAYLAWLRARLPGADALVQEYLPGPEYGLGVIGNEGALRVLPALEVDFSALPEGFSPILSYESKAVPESPYWTDIRFKPADPAPDVRGAMEAAAKRLFARFGFQDYGRFDFRCDAAGLPKLLEINPNPAWGWDGKLAMMAGFAGLDYPAFLRAIAETAARRCGLLRG